MQLEAGQSEQRQEEPALAGGEPFGDAGAFPRVFGGEDERTGGDVAVDSGFVRIRVVERIVLLQPPSVAQTDEEVADDRRHPLPLFR